MLASESKTKSGIVLRAISLGSLEILRQLANPLSTAEADLSAVDTRVPVEFLHMRGIYRLTGGSAVSYTAESSMAYRVLMGRKHPFLLLEGRTGERCAHEAPRRGTRKSVQEAAEEATAYDANNLNQYTAIQTGEEAAFVPTFDADGNQTKVKTSTGIWNVVYNAENRPVTFTSEDGATIVECTYDKAPEGPEGDWTNTECLPRRGEGARRCARVNMGRRHTRKITVNGSVTNYLRYIYRGYLQIAAINAVSGVFQWFILWDPTQPVATRPLGIRKDGTWYTYGWDLTKNICEVFGSDGYIKTAYTYTPYGSVTANGNVTQPIQWSSEYNDSELGLIYYNYRHYNPADGRWIGRDIIFSDFNVYRYVNGRVFGIDELGLLGFFGRIFRWIFGQNQDNSLVPVSPQDLLNVLRDMDLSQTPWVQNALNEYGVHESNKDKINEYADALPENIRDIIKQGGAWCACFVYKCAGNIPVPADPAELVRAKHYSKVWDDAGKPYFGSIAVRKNRGYYHVGFVVGEDPSNIYMLGGNQSDQVKISAYPKGQIISYRLPAGTPGNQPIPVINNPVNTHESTR